MTKYLVSFATSNFYYAQHLLEQSALKNGIDKTYSYSEKKIKDTEFYKENFAILSQPRGAGYWLWKPYLILETLKKVNDGDLIVYCDSGIKIVAPLDPLFKICEKNNGILLFNTSEHKNKTWTKRDCFVLMNCDQKEYWEGQQVMASFQIYKKSVLTLSFLEEWLKFAKNPNILTDIPNVSGKKNFLDFIDHRHDQSILSNLAIKHKVTLYRDPTQWGNYLSSAELYVNSPYGTLLHHHRNYGIKIKLGKLFYAFNKKSK